MIKGCKATKEQAAISPQLKELCKIRADELYNDGCQALDDKDITEAIGSFSNAINTYLKAGSKDNLAKTYTNLAICFAINKNPEGVLHVIRKAEEHKLQLEHEPAVLLSKAFYNLGLTQAPDKAIQSFEEAKTWDSTNFEATYNLGLVLMRQDTKNQYLAAQKEFKELIDNKNCPKDLLLSSLCQLIECEVKLEDDISNTLNEAWQCINDHAQEFLNNQDIESQKIYNSLIIYMYSRTTESMINQGEHIQNIQKFTKNINFEELNSDITKAVFNFFHDKALFLIHHESADVRKIGDEILQYAIELSGSDSVDDTQLFPNE